VPHPAGEPPDARDGGHQHHPAPKLPVRPKPHEGGNPNVGHAFCCFQQELDTYIAMQTRLESEMLVPYITPIGGGYFFAVPGIRNARDYYASGLLRGQRT
jgi:deferrochelatase/peroxidase EfeB